MIFPTTDPLTSRRRYKARDIETLVVIGGVFVFLVSLLSFGISWLAPSVFAMLIGDAALLAFSFYLYIIWRERPIALRCDACANLIQSNTPWICGFCKRANRNANEYPFVRECGHCHNSPKAYKCHRCEEAHVIFLSDEKDDAHYAFALNDPKEKWVDQEQVSDSRKAAVQEKKHKLEIAEFALKLKYLKEQRDRLIKKTKLKQNIEAAKEDYDAAMGMKAWVAQQKAEVEVEFRDHPDLLADALQTLEEIREKYRT